jgi:dTDP-4-amino-4,6-dideoxygalactose transaminase
MKPLFASLGSQYTWSDAWLLVRSHFFGSTGSAKQLQNYLETRYSGKAVLTYKGRDAIELALRGYGIGTGDCVLTQALSCYAIEEAIRRVGAEAVYYDLEKETITPNVQTMKDAGTRCAKPPKALILQYTLGSLPKNIEEILSFAKTQNLVVIEDIAQSAGAHFVSHAEAGTVGDCTVLSFGRDKAVDAVTGGAVVFRKKHYEMPAELPSYVSFKDVFYPFFTLFIRSTFTLQIGKVIHKILSAAGLMTNPILSPSQHAAAMPDGIAGLVYQKFLHLDETQKHRKHIADMYAQELNNLNISTETSANIRFPLAVSNVQKAVLALQKHSIYISDRWYRSPVDSGIFNFPSSYKRGDAPNAEYLAEHILNMPTHRLVTHEDAQKILSILEENI